jgi:hypothetical protein
VHAAISKAPDKADAIGVTIAQERRLRIQNVIGNNLPRFLFSAGTKSGSRLPRYSNIANERTPQAAVLAVV